MQPLENKLDRRCNTGWTAPAIELINSFAQTTNFRELGDVFHRWQVIAYLYVETSLEASYKLFKFTYFKVFIKDFEDCSIDEFLYDPFFFDITHCIKLDFATS